MTEIGNSWVFSIKEDILLHLFLIVSSTILIAIFFLNSPMNVNYFELLRPTLFIGFFFDVSHGLVTYILVYSERNDLNRYLKIVPIICLSFLLILQNFQISFLKLYILISLFHFIRQQYGVLMTTLRKGRELTKKEVYLNQLFFYNLMCTPILYFATSESFIFEWITMPFNYKESMILPNLFLFLFGFILFIQICFEFIEYNRKNIINFAKIFHSIVTIILWFIIPYSLKSWAGLTIGIIIIHHALFYFVFCYKRLPFVKKWGPITSYIIILIPTFTYMYLTATIKTLSIVLASTTLSHFIWDGFIWKKRNY